jgi:hypothetical protein
MVDYAPPLDASRKLTGASKKPSTSERNMRLKLRNEKTRPNVERQDVSTKSDVYLPVNLLIEDMIL